MLALQYLIMAWPLWIWGNVALAWCRLVGALPCYRWEDRT